MKKELVIRLMSNQFQSYQQIYALRELKHENIVSDISEADAFLTCFQGVPNSIENVIRKLEELCVDVRDSLLGCFEIDEEGDISWNSADVSDDIDDYLERDYDSFIESLILNDSILESLSNYYSNVLKKIKDYPRAESPYGISVQGCWYLYANTLKDS